ncbi:MAG: hypothetical protein BGP06_11690 [Rhizobiales bacterium 65-9]|nr:MAG: hypothetical protein BGP06_11690 [Rhizobiales bacterium 65-9]
MDDLLHPANAFESPEEVVDDPDLTLNEKRSILASWASDACALEANPVLRADRTGRMASYDDIVDALRRLDRIGRYPRRSLGRRHIFSRRAVSGFTGARPPQPPEPPRAA